MFTQIAIFTNSNTLLTSLILLDKVVCNTVLVLLVITFLTSLVKMMIPNQELTSFPSILVNMVNPNPELIMMMIMFLSSTTESMVPNPKCYTLLVN